jgi:hypothetical protein
MLLWAHLKWMKKVGKCKYSIWILVFKIWVDALCDCICEKWGNNLTTMAFTLHSIINCEPLKPIKVYKNTYLNDMMFEACQLLLMTTKFFYNSILLVNVKDAQATL